MTTWLSALNMKNLTHMDTSHLHFTNASLGILFAFFYIIFFHYRYKKASLPLPPSPKAYPIIGNLLDLPPPDAHIAKWWSHHNSLYGPISSVSVFGLTLIIINDRMIASDLFDRRSLRYSSRPPLTMAKLCGCHRATPILPYGTELRNHRREFQKYVGSSTGLARLSKMQETEARRLLLRILEEPSKIEQHVRRTSGAVILGVAYGYTPALHGKDELLELAETASDTFSEILDGGAWMVDIFPFIRHLPSWLPGMTFKRKARVWREEMRKFTDLPFNFVKQKLANGTAAPSCAASLIEHNDIDEDQMKWISSTFYAAGTDTATSVLLTFFLAMVLYPNVQRRAQQEIDTVVGRDRLPSLCDKEDGQLPYVEALMKETLRWNSVAPLGAPHVCTEEDQYGGYRIPKGAIVMANIWHIAHDPNVYSEPHTFKPERFLGPDAEPDPLQYSFGYGRRICPGRDFALQSLFLAISMALATFSICKARDDDGCEVIPKCEFTTGGLSRPKPFAYSIRPRDDQAVALVQSVMGEYSKDRGDADELKALASACIESRK